MPFEDEPFVFRLDKGEAPGYARKDCAHPASDDLIERIDERKFLLVESGVLRDCQHHVRGVPFLQLSCDVVNEELVAGNRQAVLSIEIVEVRELARELATEAWVGENLPITLALVPLHKCRNEPLLALHGGSGSFLDGLA